MNISVDGVILPNKPLSNFDLQDAAKKIKIPRFRGVFVRDILPRKARKQECGILNLDGSSGNGTHWVAWEKRDDAKYYFDSYGIQPPLELIRYLKSPILYNSERIQPDGEVFCGHLCLHVLKQLSLGKHFQEVINNLY
jgi:hypothetical protein